MFKSTLLITLCLVAVTLASIHPNDVSGRIVGGEDASPGQFPYQASLRYKSSNFHFCGASIISAEWILTAGHCTDGQNANDMIVVLGAHLITDKSFVYDVERIVDHPKYNPNGLVNDIALIKVRGQIEFNDRVKKIDLNRDNTPGDVWGIASGWGAKSVIGGGATTLQWLNTKTVAENKCNPYSLCTLTQAGEGLCFGDSGGPLNIEGKLAGVVSAGVPCALGFADTFTRVSYYIDWIYGETHIN